MSSKPYFREGLLGPLPKQITLHEADLAALQTLVRRIEFEQGQKPTSASVDLAPHTLLDAALKIYRARRLREKSFGQIAFSEPPWDMLLSMYCVSQPKQRLTVSGLAYASGSPIATAIRWQERLLRAGLIKRTESESDGRVVYVELSEKGIEQMEDYLTLVLKLYMRDATDAGASFNV